LLRRPSISSGLDPLLNSLPRFYRIYGCITRVTLILFLICRKAPMAFFFSFLPLITSWPSREQQLESTFRCELLLSLRFLAGYIVGPLPRYPGALWSSFFFLSLFNVLQACRATFRRTAPPKSDYNLIRSGHRYGLPRSKRLFPFPAR